MKNDLLSGIRFSFRVRIFLLVSALMIASMSALSFFLLKNLKDNMSEEFRERGVLIATEFSQKIAEGTVIEDRSILDNFVSQLWGTKDILYIRIHNDHGLRLAQKFLVTDLEKHLPPSPSTCTMNIREIPAGETSPQAMLDIISPIIYEKKCVGYVRLGISIERIRKEVKDRLINASILVVLFIFVGLIFSFLFSRSFSKPISSLLDGVRKIEKGHLSYHVDVKNRDEIGELAIAFNQMTDRLRASDEELKKYAQVLEQRVEERTIELEKINLQLEKDIIARNQIERALRESKERYQMLFNHLPAGVIHYDASSRILDFNNRFAEIMGAAGEKLVGFNMFMMFDNDEMLKALQVSLTGTLGFFEGSYVSVFSNKRLFLRVVFDGITNEEGSFIGGVGLFEDITGRKKAEEERTHLQTQLQHAQKMEAIGTLAGGVAHDLNNILSGLVTYPELLLKNLSDQDPLKQPISTILKSGREATAIVHDLLILARRGVMIKEVININDIIAELLQTSEFKQMSEANPGVLLDVQYKSRLTNILGSSVHLAKCFMNIICNSMEALPDGGKVVISTAHRMLEETIQGYEDIAEGDYAILTVSDSGRGMSDEEIKRIFEPFYTKKVLKRRGTGLGMAVVWGTVKDHDGYIDIPGNGVRGSRFDLYFPATNMTSKSEAGVPTEDISGNEKILIVDDIEQQLEIASLILQELGYSVAVASSGEAAVEYMKNHHADLVILDMIMEPGIDGLETYKRILKVHPHQKAIIVSGFSENERLNEAKQIGVGSYIKKPYSLESIGQAVRTELDA